MCIVYGIWVYFSGGPIWKTTEVICLRYSPGQAYSVEMEWGGPGLIWSRGFE